MSLKEELNLSKPLVSLEHEALLSIYYTDICIRKRAAEFLSSFGLTDVQFNLMMMLKHNGGTEGLSQARLAELMMVNRANITGLIDRLEKLGMLRRTAAADRRYNIIQLTDKGRSILDKADPAYGREVQRVMKGLTKTELKDLVSACEKLRRRLT
ncbi:MAG: MarR family transcriptional regulator [Planctomycetaceae bacterium]|nr:MarR family transcriptional regulator [Planctomycetaceae bacterium]